MNFFRRQVLCTSMFLSLFLCSTFAHAGSFDTSAVAASHVTRISAYLSELKTEKKSLVALIKSKSIKGKKLYKALNMESDAALYLSDLKKLRRKFSKLQDKILGQELLGEVSENAKTKLNRLSNKYGMLEVEVVKLRDKISLFVAYNTVVPSNFQGTWNTNFGKIVFAQFSDNFVTGTYYYNGGGIAKGKVKGPILKGTYTGNNGETGTFKIEMIEEGKSWIGSYKNSDGTIKGAWVATKA